MIGILTEKPSAMRNFAKALGGTRGMYNGEEYILVAARGHLYEFSKPEQQVAPALVSQYKSWALDNLPWKEQDFQWKREKKKDTATTIQTIQSTLSQCDEIVIATDVDPTGEGELLAWEILDEANIRAKKYSRMYFDDESVKQVQKAFVSRKQIPSMLQDMDYVKALYRSKWDFLSMQFTRVATMCGDGKSVLRQGRLKSSMVSITGDGLNALAGYKKIPFYQNRFRDENGNVFSNPDEPSFPDKKQVPKTYVDSAVIVDKKEKKATAPPKLLDLSTLSSILSGKGVKAKDVLSVYQKMYEAQIVSYPRTEDKVITPEQFDELLPKIDAIATVVGIDPGLLTHRTPRSSHVKTGGAHGANRPGPNVPKSLDDLNQYGKCAPMIYQILAQNYLATLAEDYEYEHQTGHLEKYPAFVGTANVPMKMGYKLVFSAMDEDEEVDSGKGLGTMASPFVHEGFPPKPPTPTMKWLMKQLEKHDVGTGATRTSIYADVTSDCTQYPLLKETRGKLSMTQYGEMSYLLLKDTHIGNLKITEDLQQDMRDIVAGKANPEECLHRMQQLVMDDIETMKKNSVVMRKELGVMEKVEKEKFTGMWNGKAVSFTREWSGHRFTDEECEALCNGEEIEVLGLTSKTGKTYGVTGKLTEQTYNGHKFIGFERTGFAGDSNQTAKADRCSGVWNGENISFKRDWGGHHFTDEECEALLAGKEIEILGLVSKAGKPYGVKGKLTRQNYNGHLYVGFEKTGFADSDAKIPDEWCQHVFTDDEKTMLEAGKEVQLDGCISKVGKVFACKVKWGKNDNGRQSIIIV